MTSQIRFDPPGVAGLVASGTSLADAAERLGAPLELECGGKGECTSCAVRMKENPFALDEVTEAERQMLGEERIFEGVRLACQAHARTGDCVVEILGRPAPEPELGDTAAGDPHARVLEAFEQLPASEQLSTAFELQMKVAGDLLGTLLETPMKVGEQVLSSIFGAPPAAGEPEQKKEEAPPGKANGADEPHG
jgi:ferredoxin